MIKKTLSSIKKIKSKDAVVELQRAHAIIGILSLSLAFLLLMGAFQPVEFEPVLAVIAASLLGIVALISLGIFYLLKKRS